jgi:hypothetical protein
MNCELGLLSCLLLLKHPAKCVARRCTVTSYRITVILNQRDITSIAIIFHYDCNTFKVTVKNSVHFLSTFYILGGCMSDKQ